MFKHCGLLANGLLATATVIPFGGGVSAQTPTGPSSVQMRPTPSAGVTTPSNPAQNPLSSYLEKVEWNPSSQGPLLIVSPEETQWDFHVDRGPDGRRTALTGPQLPMPDETGGYPLAAWADYFARKLVVYPTLTVFAPTTMVRLADRHLPKPGGFAALSSSDKARLLVSTFTPDQWQRLASPEGIGAGDLNSEQRELYLSLLPEPFLLDATTPGASDDAGKRVSTLDATASPVILSDEQRAAVRLTVHKQLDWNFKMGNNGTYSSRGSAGASDGAAYHLRPTPRTMNPRGQAVLFGVPMTEVEPNRPKLGQLSPDLSGSTLAIPLGGDKTVGELVHRIAQATGSELYADARYGMRHIYVRGTSANVGDLLQGLALAVTGTWRHVGPVYVLTDDLEGLGVRHARIADWIGQNGLLAEVAQEQADSALSGVRVTDLVPWSDTDPLRPDAALAQKIEAAAQQSASAASGQSSLFVPLGELPAVAQSAISDQLKQAQENRQRIISVGRASTQLPINTDGVNVLIHTRSQYLVAGFGAVDSPDIQNAMNETSRSRPLTPWQNITRSPSSIAFPKNCPMRALLIAPHSTEEIAGMVGEARRCGFTQLWVQTDREDTTLLPVAVQQANANQLTVQAVVPLLHATATDLVDAIDRNILGKSTTEYIRQERSIVHSLNIPEELPNRQRQPGLNGINSVTGRSWRDSAAIARLLATGDYLRSDDAEVQRTLIADLRKFAATPGVAGLVLRDAVPPGYSAPTRIPSMLFGFESAQATTIEDPLLALGYSESMRLKALRQFGCDPIDLSPLPNGDVFPNLGMGMGPRGSLPFFPDFGTGSRYHISGGPVGEVEAATVAAAAWHDLKVSTNNALLQAIAATLRSQSPGFAVTSRAEGKTASSNGGAWFGSVDAPVSEPAAPTLAAPTVPPSADGSPVIHWTVQPTMSLLSEARQSSRSAFLDVPINPADHDPALADAEAFWLLVMQLRQATGWDGVVVDVTSLTPARAAALLRAMPDASQPDKIP